MCIEIELGGIYKTQGLGPNRSVALLTGHMPMASCLLEMLTLIPRVTQALGLGLSIHFSQHGI